MKPEWRVQKEEREGGFRNSSHTPHLFNAFTVCGALGTGYYYTREPLPKELFCSLCGSDLRCKRCLKIEAKMKGKK